MSKEIPRVIAIFLPQFYETEDNNKWWGKGFTDWESVKNAQPCFDGHDVPWKPLNGNYYDLSKYETLKMQAELAKKYRIGGFCFYHYYFEKGKKELELPAENLLRWKDIDMPFCFNWASESWIRSWSRIDGNVWSEKYEKGIADTTNGVLVRQDYGDENDWKMHFEYLLPFFMDERYIRVENKPVFIFYRPNDIKPLQEMVSLWRKLAKRVGLDGLYLIGANANVLDLGLDAAVVYEPRTAINHLNEQEKAFVQNGVRCFDYTEVWNSIIQDRPFLGCKTYYTGITGYDDTPRRGNSGECLVNNTARCFESGLKSLIEKSIRANNELVFLNAWNEWGEGMYLEPDEKKQYSYLESVKGAIDEIEDRIDTINVEQLDVEMNQEVQILKKDALKYKSFVEILDKWLETERNRKFNFRKFFTRQGIRTVAIYGMAMMGKQLYQQLMEESIIPIYGIDRYVGQYGDSFKIIRPEENYPEVDAIIVTTYDNEQIVRMIKGKSKAIIFTIEELIEYFWRNE